MNYTTSSVKYVHVCMVTDWRLGIELDFECREHKCADYSKNSIQISQQGDHLQSFRFGISQCFSTMQRRNMIKGAQEKNKLGYCLSPAYFTNNRQRASEHAGMSF